MWGKSIDENRKLITKIKQLEIFDFSDFEIKQIVLVSKSLYNGKIKKTNIPKYIFNLKTNNVRFNNLVDRFIKIKSLGKDSSSFKACCLRYGNEKGREIFEGKRAATTISLSNFIKKYGEINGKQRWEEFINFKKTTQGSLENYINYYGKEQGTKKWESYCLSRANTYKKNKAAGKYKERGTLQWWIKTKNSVELVTEAYNSFCEKTKYYGSTQFYIDKYGTEDGIKISKDKADHHSINYFRNKTESEKEAQKLYKENCKKIKKSSYSLKNLIKKHGKITGHKLWDKYIKKIKLSVNKALKNKTFKLYSELEISFFDKVITGLKIDTFYYGKNQKLIKSDLDEFWVDFLYKNKIIEFNGDVFHANPNIFNANDRPNPFKPKLKASQIWKKDQYKIDFLKSLDYDVLEIWEQEYKNSPEICTEKARNFLTNN